MPRSVNKTVAKTAVLIFSVGQAEESSSSLNTGPLPGVKPALSLVFWREPSSSSLGGFSGSAFLCQPPYCTPLKLKIQQATVSDTADSTFLHPFKTAESGLLPVASQFFLVSCITNFMSAMSFSSCAFSKCFFAAFFLICWILVLRCCTFLLWVWKNRAHFTSQLRKMQKQVSVYRNRSLLFYHLFLEGYSFLHTGDLLTCMSAWVLPGEILNREEIIQNKIHQTSYNVHSRNV